MLEYPHEATEWKGNMFIKIDGKITEKPYFNKKIEVIKDEDEMASINNIIKS